MSRFLCYLAFLWISHSFFHGAEAVPSLPRNRVTLPYTKASDECRKITESSDPAAKAAADAVCGKAFEALDDMGANSCHGWRRGKCRILDGKEHGRCTCKVSESSYLGIRVKTKTFRECALTGTEQIPYGEVQQAANFHGEVQPTANFQGAWGTSDNTLEVSRSSPALWNFGSISMRDPPFFSVGSSSGAGAEYNKEQSMAWNTVSAESKSQTPTEHNCLDCKTYYSTWSNLLKHFKKRHPGIAPARTIPMTTDGRAHGRLWPTDHHCHLCNKYYTTRGNLGRHFTKEHPGKERAPSTKTGRGGPKYFKCEVCGKSYCWEKTLNAHKKSHEEDIECHICHKDFDTRNNLERHINQSHPEATTAPSKKVGRGGPKNFKCELCGKAFGWNKSLRRHRQGHEEDLECHACDINFDTKASLERHINYKHPVTPSGLKDDAGPSAGSKRKRA